jgi:hypothetical protein
VKKIFYSLVLITLSASVFGQDIKTSVKGMITDLTTGLPVPGVNIKIESEAGTFTGQTNDAGKYSVETGIGRYRFTASSTGYESVSQEILTSAGKGLTLNISLHQSVQQLKEIEVESSMLQPELAGQRSLTIEKTLRIPANFFDPVRVITAYPGVVTANDQGNSIIVRGNSPNGLLWKLNGVDIVNPNHLSNAGTFSDKPMANGGGVNIISGQMIDKTDFYMGQVPTAYGNALAGIIDMNLREGNKQKLEVTAQASLIGLDVAAEGPLGKNENTSFLVNYRYSTVGLLSKAGIDFGDETITFQDLSFHLNHRGSKGMVFSLFGFWGDSKNEFEAKAPEDWEQEKDQYDINYKSNTGALGANVTIPLVGGKLSGAVAYSSTSQSRISEIDPSAYLPVFFVKTDNYDQSNALLSANLVYSSALSKSVEWDIGISANSIDNSVNALKVLTFYNDEFTYEQRVNGGNDGVLIQPYANFKVSVSSVLSLSAGVRYVNYSYNGSSAVEPRLSGVYKTSEKSSFALSYGLISQTQLPQFYAVTKDLELTKAHHFDGSYTTVLSNDIQLRTGLYYQKLFDVPIGDGYLFSAINFLEGNPPTALISEGTGTNYGADITVEKQFFNKHYVLLGGSYYNSKYIAGDGLERSSRFNGHYTFSAIHGKEWTKETKRRTIGLNTRVLYLGGMRQSEVIEDQSILSGETFYNEGNPYSKKLGDYFRLDLRLSFRKNKPGYTRTFAIDIQNLTNQQNDAYEYYDRVQAKTVMKYHLGIIPLLVYRVDF